MYPDSCGCENPYLLLRIIDTVPLHLCRERELLSVCRPLPDCFRLESACLSGAPYLTDQRSVSRCGGVNFSASLHLPMRVALLTDCGRDCIEGEVCIPVCAVFRCPCRGNEQIIPEACVRVYDARHDRGGLLLCMDVDVTLYVTMLCPAALSCSPAPACPAPNRPSHLPLYPELPF